MPRKVSALEKTTKRHLWIVVLFACLLLLSCAAEDPSGGPVVTEDSTDLPLIVEDEEENDKLEPEETVIDEEQTATATAPPSTPTLLLPEDEEVFIHFPRTTTLEWTLQEDDVVDRYNIEVQVHYSNSDEWSDRNSYTTEQTEVTFRWVGANRGRWRVNAENDLGVSDWSTWRYFNYTR